MRDRGLLWQLFLVALVIVAAGVLSGCVHPKPKPPAKPPQPPVVETGRPSAPVFIDMLLRAEDGHFVLKGQPHELSYAIPCWPPDGTVLRVDGVEVPNWWTLFSPEWVARTREKGFDAYHLRTGPYNELCCGLESAGNSTTPAWWAFAHKAIRAAGEARATAEVDVLDGWQVKHAIWGEVSLPWPAEHVHGAMAVPLNASVLGHVKQVVRETCNYGNVIYQIGNETNLAPGWSVEWETAMHGAIREAEQQEGCAGLVHLIGSNAGGTAGPWDYYALHEHGALTGPVDGKPVVQNEFNPPHPSPEEWHSRYCQSKAAGQSYGWWLGGADEAYQDRVFALMKGGCDAQPACPLPRPDRSKLFWKLEASWGGFTDATPNVRGACDYCAEIGMGEYNGQIRCSCPARNEGDPNRVPCEQYLIEAPAPVWSCDGGTLVLDGSGWRARCDGGGKLRVCNGPGTVCAEAQP